MEEEARLRSLVNVLNAAGFEPFTYEDFADETFELLRKVASALPAGNADVLLHDTFNDENGPQNYIVTHLKVRPLQC